jgi:cytochrome c oxidase cbb3-type subunit 3
MPAFGRDGILQANEIQFLTSYVRTLSGAEKPGAASQRGAALFAVNCAACHGAGGKGNRTLGAPNLTDKIWLYGGDRASIAETITNARYGIMPAWGQRLDPVTVKMLAAYVHSLGGGEKFVAEAPAIDAQVKAEAGAVPAPVKANASR